MKNIGVRHPLPGVVYQSHRRLKDYVEKGVLTDETLVSSFRDAWQAIPAARRTIGSRLALDPYPELNIMTDKAASAFLHPGLKPQDRILFQLPNTRELMIAFLACLKAGLIRYPHARCTSPVSKSATSANMRKPGRTSLQAGDCDFDFIAFCGGNAACASSPLEITIATRSVLGGDLGGPGASLEEADRCRECAGCEPNAGNCDRHTIPIQVALFQLLRRHHRRAEDHSALPERISLHAAHRRRLSWL